MAQAAPEASVVATGAVSVFVLVVFHRPAETKRVNNYAALMVWRRAVRVGLPTCWSRDGLHRIWIEQQPYAHLRTFHSASLLLWRCYWSARRAQTSRRPISGSLSSKPCTKACPRNWLQPGVFRSFNLQHSRLHPLLGKAPQEAVQPLPPRRP